MLLINRPVARTIISQAKRSHDFNKPGAARPGVELNAGECSDTLAAKL